MADFKGLTWANNVSFSAFNNYKECNRRFYYEKVLKIPTTNKVETKWGRFGNCVHEAIENCNLQIKDIKEHVQFYWEKYKLFDTDMSFDSALKQTDYALNLPYNFKHKEEKILFEIDYLKFKLIIDGTLEDGSILDWKTSTFAPKKVEDYKQQLLWYVWGTWKAKGTIPPKAILVFTKAEKIFEWSFTLEELQKFEDHIKEVITEYNTKKGFNDWKPNYKSCFFCGYKLKCQADQLNIKEDLNVELRIDHDTVTIQTDMSLLFNDTTSKQFSYEMDNAHFVKKAMLAKGVKNFDTTVRLYRNQSCSIAFKREIIKLLNYWADSQNKNLNIKENDVRVLTHISIKVPDSLNKVTLRPYQLRAVKHIIKDKISMTEICTGAGKTVIAAEIIRRLGFKTLFVVDRNILLSQTVKEFKKHFESVGTWTEGVFLPGDIIVASIQTINKDLIGDRLTQFGVVIIDEAHGAKAKSYKKLMKKIVAEYRIGLTGTAYSDGNASLELYKSFGIPNLKIRAIDLINEGYLVMPEIKFLDYDEGFITNGSYNEVYDQILKCKDRLNKLRELIKQHQLKNILIMVDKLEHIQVIKDLIYDGMLYTAFVINGSTKKNDRDKILKSINRDFNTDFGDAWGNFLIATSSIIQKGVDIPKLDVIINYSANLGTVKTIQSLGRVLRASPGKTKAYYYDFNDKHRMLKKHTKARKEALIEQGYTIQ